MLVIYTRTVFQKQIFILLSEINVECKHYISSISEEQPNDSNSRKHAN